MALTVGDFVAQRLDQWGIQRIYGYPGHGINRLARVSPPPGPGRSTS
jgi:thiamine pyrophosphate-dependent acetolactate synthase large subunit-like protein